MGQSAVPSDSGEPHPRARRLDHEHRRTAAPAATAIRADLRNVAIVAHVDHGKTTLVDAMLRQTGAFRSNQAVVDRVMDSGDLEREKGITILAKQTTIDHAGVRLNIVDTPGHADFGGEVERSLLMVDSVLLLVDAAEGPLPQTRYVLQKAMARRLPVIVALNKIDRGDARPAEVLDDVYELFMDLGADAHQIEFPIVYTNAKAGTATRDLADPGHGPPAAPRSPHRGHPAGRPTRPAIRSSSSSPTCPPTSTSAGWRSGGSGTATIRTGQRIVVVREEADDTAGSVEPGRTVTLNGTVTSLQTAHGIERIDIEEAGPGDIVSVAGLPEVTIGDTLTDPADPRPLPRLDVDAPTLRMTFGVNTSPLAGREGKYVTSRQIKARLEREVLGNVSIEVRPSETSEAFEVRGRGELQLAVLIEQMRREGFELTASRPEVLLREVDGEIQEPYERITIDIPPDYIGEVQTAIAGRKGRLEQISTDTDGRVRMEYVLPVRGLIGYRGQLLTDTRGTALLHQIGEGYGPWAGDVTHRTNGVLVSDRAGHVQCVRAVQPRAALGAVHRGRGRGLRGDDRRRELAVGRHGRQPDEGEEAHEHPDPLARRVAPPDAAAADHARDARSSSSPPTSSSRSPRSRSACASVLSRSTTGAARPAEPRTCDAPPNASPPPPADAQGPRSRRRSPRSMTSGVGSYSSSSGRNVTRSRSKRVEMGDGEAWRVRLLDTGRPVACAVCREHSADGGLRVASQQRYDDQDESEAGDRPDDELGRHV